MKRLHRILDALLGSEPEAKRLTKEEELQLLAEKVSKLPLHFSEPDLKTIAHNILDSSRDADVLASRIVRTRTFYLTFLIFLLLSALLGWRLIAYYANQFQTRTQAAFELRYTEVTNQMQVKLQTTYQEVTNNIALKFQEETFSNIVVSVASAEATNIFLNQLEPTITNFVYTLTNSFNGLQTNLVALQATEAALSNAFSGLQTNMDSLQFLAKAGIANLKQLSDFYSLLLKAQTDDRYAFWQLEEVAASTNSNSELAKRVCASITGQLLLHAISLSAIDAGAILKSEGFDFQTNSIIGFEFQLNANATAIKRIALLRAMHHQDRFPLKERLEVLSNWISFSPSLLVQDEACRLMGEQAKLGKNLMAYQEYLDWFSNWSKTNTVSKP